mmetsp:Transcript_21056/g.25807  ORF Transcript_21056/g.25807 Transcript_21056/m.25807 type:complete len:88 (+) Transcript_21056:188-451(+)
MYNSHCIDTNDVMQRNIKCKKQNKGTQFQMKKIWKRTNVQSNKKNQIIQKNKRIHPSIQSSFANQVFSNSCRQRFKSPLHIIHSRPQ